MKDESIGKSLMRIVVGGMQPHRCYGLNMETFPEHLVPRWWYWFWNWKKLVVGA